MAWYVIVLIVASSLFLLTAIGSLFFGDMDMDADIDAGFLLSDVISFKGLLHFTIGFSLTLTLMNECTLLSASIGAVAGIIFALVLYYVYSLFFVKLKQSMNYTTEINDMEAEVYFWDNNRKIGEVFVTLEGRPVTVTLVNDGDIRFEKGQKIRVSGTRSSVRPAENSQHLPEPSQKDT